MWRFVLLAASVVAGDERWSRQASDRRLNDWVPLNTPIQHHQPQQGRAIADQGSAASSSLPSVLTPPAQPTHQHPRLLPPPPPPPDGLFQHAATSGFINSFSPHFNEKPRQFLPPQVQNNRPQPTRFQQNVQQQQQQSSQISDSPGIIPPHLFQVGPHQFSNNEQASQTILGTPQFIGPQFLTAQPQQPFVQLTGPQLLQQTIPNFQEFQLQNNQPIYLQQPARLPNVFGQPPPPINRPASPQPANNTKNFKFPDQQNQDKEVQLLYVPVETLRQRGRTLPSGGFRANSFNGNLNNFEQAHANTHHQQTKSQFRGQKPQESGEQIYTGTEGQIFQQYQETQTPKHFFQETSGPQIQSQTPRNFFQETSAPNLQTTPKQYFQETPAPQIKSQPSSLSQQYIPEHTTAFSGLDLQSPSSGISVTPSSLDVSSTLAESSYDNIQNDRPLQTSERYNYNQYQQEFTQQNKVRPQKQEINNQNYQSQTFANENPYNQQLGFDDQRRQTTLPPPHQPPLSVYMESNAHSKIADVLSLLKSSKTIPVLDTVGPDSPQVFVGPSNLNPPSGYLKFELPYLSSLDSNRVERKVDKLPFFVAPLNFQPPPGYSKIPFPAPHIGSVVVSNLTVFKTALHDKPFAFDSPAEENTPSSVEQPFTLPVDISPISPQLPSLINSLQDDKYYQSTTTELPVTTTATAFTRRTPLRGSNRGYSSTTTTETPTRRPANRQRRPYNNRHSNRVTQSVSSTTTESFITTLPPQIDHAQNDENKFYSDFTTENIPQNFNQNFRQPVYETPQRGQFLPQNQDGLQPSLNNQPQFSNQFAFNNDNSNENQQNFQNEPSQPEYKQQFTSQEQQYIQGSDENIKVPAEISSPFYNTPKSYVPSQEHTTQEVLSDFSQQITTESERVASSTRGGQRRDPLRQRFRSRNPYHPTTEPTTTEPQQYQQKVKHEQQYLQQTVQYKQNNNNYEGQLSNYPTNTERSDEQPVTENDQGFKITFPDTENRASPNQLNKAVGQPGQFYSQFKEQEQQISQPQQQQQQQQQQFNNNVPQTQYDSSTYAQEDQTGIQHNVNSQNQATPQIFSSHNAQVSTPNFQNSQQAFEETSVKYEGGELTEKPINQQRLTKYTRTRGRGGQSSRDQSEQSSPHTFRGHDYSYNSQQNRFNDQTVDNTFTTTTESDVEKDTPKPAVVRVRGRVRGRTRSNLRQTTTTEAPNYPVESGLLNETPVNEGQSRKPHRNQNSYSAERGGHNRHPYRFRSSATTSDDSNVDHESSTTHANEKSTTESAAAVPVSRTYNHILNRNKVRRPIGTTASERHITVQSTTPSSTQEDSNTKYLLRTTRKPTTKLTTGRGRIRRPSNTATSTTTTEYPPLDSVRDNFAPSAASNEVIDPYYSNQNSNYNNNNNNNNFNNYETQNEKILVKQQQRPVSYTETPVRHRQTSPATNADDDYWNQAVTIQQSNSYDFSAESSPVTQSTLNGQYFSDDYFDHKQTPTYADGPVYNPSQDQTPFSSNEQLIAYSKSKSKPGFDQSGKVNQWNEKEEKKEEQYDIEGRLINGSDQQEDLYANHQSDSVTAKSKDPVDSVSGEMQGVEDSSHRVKEVQIEEQITQEATPETDKTSKDNANNPTKLIDPVTGKKPGRRRGAWVRVRVNKKPHDVFETAESQNLASLTNNAIKSTGLKDNQDKEYAIPPNHRPTDPYTTDEPEMNAEASTTTTTEAPAVDYEKTLTDMIRDMLKEQQTEEGEEEAAQEQQEKSEETVVINKESSTTTPATIFEDITSSVEATTMGISHDIEAITVVPEITTKNTEEEKEGITESMESSTDSVTTAPRVLGTSTTTEISLETEICYRGRCVKSKKNKKKQQQPDYESDLMPVE